MARGPEAGDRPDPNALGPVVEGVVVRRISNVFWVRAPGAAASGIAEFEYACSRRARMRKEQVDIRVGDRVRISNLDPVNSTALITEVQERVNTLPRPPIANVDQVLVVVAASQPEFSSQLLDRFLVLVQMSGLPAAIVINKRDLVSTDRLAALVGSYRALGYPVVATSARLSDVAGLERILAGQVSVFAGPSGVGKSSLLNALDPRLSLKEGEVSSRLGTGRHTTTFASLHAVAGGLVADTPGYSHLEFPDWPPEELGWLFPEMVPWIPRCPLSKCQHDSEPDCAVKNRAEIAPARFESYLRFLEELRRTHDRALSSTSKVESATKMSGGGESARRLVRIDAEQREDSRRLTHQRLAELATQAASGELDEEELDDLAT